MPSGEIRKIRMECFATIGQVGNIDHENVSIGKAGRSRWMGQRPHVRGVAMNPVDHPLGGGEGKTSGELRHPVSPWGLPTKGYKTRNSSRPTSASFNGEGNDLVNCQTRCPGELISPIHHRHALFANCERQEYGSIVKEEGPFVDTHLLPRRSEVMNRRAEKEGHQDVVAPIDRHTRDGRPHARRAQREEVHSRVCHGEHGRPQARRVRRPRGSSRATRRVSPRRRRRSAAPRAHPGVRVPRRTRVPAASGCRWRRQKPAGQGKSHDRGARDLQIRADVGAEAGLVLALIRGKDAEIACAGDAQVHAQGRLPTTSPRCCIRSAIANAQNEDGFTGDVDNLYVSACYANREVPPRSACGPIRRPWGARSAC